MVVEASDKEKLDEVDMILAAEDGQIKRSRDPKMCHHNARQKCAHCLPIDPYDEDYLKSKDIKHMSFHAHVRKLTSGHGKGSQVKRPLENIRCAINLNCPAHKPYPKGVCTKCKPPMMTLNRQDAFFLSAEECITAGYLQSKNPNITEYCSDRHFGSKFVTVVASGDEQEQVNFHGYQEKNQYGAEVLKDGRPLPVEFLLVDVPTGMPKEPQYTFSPPRTARFAIENRDTMGEIQGGANLSAYCAEYTLNEFLEQATNFHFLLYLMTNHLVQFSEVEMQKLCFAVSTQDREIAIEWARETLNWQQLVALCHEQGHSHASAAASTWSCKHCTFENTEQRPDCSMCGLPANA
ncbi:hypothetical protein Y032_0040g293 [Ancylostoma ceylanicum]|nr:hypothetical protein Y032_0040g293 [Ancylostoma ceylanicum]